MSKFKVGDKVLVTKTDYPKNVPIGTKGIVSSFCLSYPRIRVGNKDYEWVMHESELELIITPTESKEDTTESTTKKIKQSLLKLYLSDTNKTIKSEKIIDYVKQEIGTDYVFGDTILRGLRQLRQDGVIDYTADKQTREYTFK